MKLTRSFLLSEFSCKDGTPVPNEYLQNVQQLSDQLQVIHDTIGFPIIVLSGYRTHQHNIDVGGAPHSQHLLAKAADIIVHGLTAKEIHTIVLHLIDTGKILQGGLGLYNGFVHYDIRGFKARWDLRK